MHIPSPISCYLPDQNYLCPVNTFSIEQTSLDRSINTNAPYRVSVYLSKAFLRNLLLLAGSTFLTELDHKRV
ncbi:hypothetical protein SADUNF_Sadunf08G0137400 [Salix dunnii]|uniref:Uncharacterized protein n=1 Tax=Salix dunnii TaxID=1413687 RepID=A0A835K0Q6_9ROSI|nr:hypothetical protein SADUNF_Sadunf08G0137400 [Salix dunnii]